MKKNSVKKESIKKRNIVISAIALVFVIVAGFIIFDYTNAKLSENEIDKTEIANDTTNNTKNVDEADDENKGEAVYYTDEKAQKLFVEDSAYLYTDLKSHELYIQKDTLHIDFYFNKDAQKSQLDKARMFALSTFAMKYSPENTDSPYMSFNSSNSPATYKTVCCRIYVDGKMNSEDNYDENGQLLGTQD